MVGGVSTCKYENLRTRFDQINDDELGRFGGFLGYVCFAWSDEFWVEPNEWLESKYGDNHLTWIQNW